ncbi:MAG: hypothetical protein IOD12_01305, partial [Silvanigrellales bacterium]|nr:hypothetical protein [Silvanigrellales bacterium]
MSTKHPSQATLQAPLFGFLVSARSGLAGLLGVLSLAVPNFAAAGAMSHEYYSRGRSPYGS